MLEYSWTVLPTSSPYQTSVWYKNRTSGVIYYNAHTHGSNQLTTNQSRIADFAHPHSMHCSPPQPNSIEVRNAMYCCQRRSEPQSQKTHRKFSEVWTLDFWDGHAERQTYRHADRNPLQPSQGRSKYESCINNAVSHSCGVTVAMLWTVCHVCWTISHPTSHTTVTMGVQIHIKFVGWYRGTL